MLKEEYRSSKKWPYHVSCGGVVYRETGGDREYALLVRRGGKRGADADSWHLPKGTLARTETLEQAALREIREESGLAVSVEGYLGTLHSHFVHPSRGHLIDKTTHYFLCRWTGECVPMDDEHDAVEWCSLGEALALLQRVPKAEGALLKRAEELLSRLNAESSSGAKG